jgi:hypothetical protein
VGKIAEYLWCATVLGSAALGLSDMGCCGGKEEFAGVDDDHVAIDGLKQKGSFKVQKYKNPYLSRSMDSSHDLEMSLSADDELMVPQARKPKKQKKLSKMLSTDTKRRKMQSLAATDPASQLGGGISLREAAGGKKSKLSNKAAAKAERINEHNRSKVRVAAR